MSLMRSDPGPKPQGYEVGSDATTPPPPQPHDVMIMCKNNSKNVNEN